MYGGLEFLKWLAHPLVILVAEKLIISLAAGFTSPRSPSQVLAFALLISCTWLGVYAFPEYVQSTSVLSGIAIGAMLSPPFGFFDRLILRRWAYENQKAIFATRSDQGGKDEVPKPTPGAGRHDQRNISGSRYAFGSEVSGFLRGLGTPFEIKYIPPFSVDDPEYVPTPATFIASKLLTIVACYYTVEYTMDWRVSLDRSLYSPAKVSFFATINELSLNDVWARLVIGVTTWLWSYSFLQFFYSIPAAIAVCLKPSEVSEWRPIFGSVGDAYTLRGFWGKFWHQLLKINPEGPARFITYDVLRIPRGTVTARYVFLFSVFFVSGCIHVSSDFGVGVMPSESRAVRFFITQAFGIVLEDVVQAVYQRTRGDRKISKNEEFWKLAVGYAWVLLFLCWSTPVWQYPHMRVEKREDNVIALSALRSLRPPAR